MQAASTLPDTTGKKRTEVGSTLSMLWQLAPRGSRVCKDWQHIKHQREQETIVERGGWGGTDYVQKINITCRAKDWIRRKGKRINEKRARDVEREGAGRRTWVRQRARRQWNRQRYNNPMEYMEAWLTAGTDQLCTNSLALAKRRMKWLQSTGKSMCTRLHMRHLKH